MSNATGHISILRPTNHQMPKAARVRIGDPRTKAPFHHGSWPQPKSAVAATTSSASAPQKSAETADCFSPSMFNFAGASGKPRLVLVTCSAHSMSNVRNERPYEESHPAEHYEDR